MLLKAPQVAKAWKKFVYHGKLDKTLPSVVARSWERCLTKLDPFTPNHLDKLEEHRFKELLEKYSMLIEVAKPIMEEIYLSMKGSGFCVILTDPQGYILKVLGDTSFMEKARRVNLSQGVNWHEHRKGTNAIGTALVEEKPVTIFAHEHLLKENHFLTCSAAPIFNSKGEIVGVLDISGNYYRAHPHNLALVVAGAKAIQNRLVMLEGQKLKNITPVYQHKAVYSFDSIIGESEKMQMVIKLARRAAQTESTVLLQGESGTGKELLAHAIHNKSSRCHGPFVAINCGGVPQNLVESELFGYEEGAFTGARAKGAKGKFELANGGTLFLDEIAELPLDCQAALLRVLQEKCYHRIGGVQLIPADVRIIAATNKNLYEQVQQGKFRLDLYYRLNVITIEIPPLRERREDIGILTSHILADLSSRYHHTGLEVSPQVDQLFYTYSWPGNVRELVNVLERAIHLADNNIILPEHLPTSLQALSNVSPQETGGTVMDNLEFQTISLALKQHNNNITQTSRYLGISRNTLYRKIQKYGIKI